MVKLKDGMIVVLADKSFGIVCGDYIYTDAFATYVKRYTDDLMYYGDVMFDASTEKAKHELDIESVYLPEYHCGIRAMLSCSFVYDKDYCKCVWKRSSREWYYLLRDCSFQY